MKSDNYKITQYSVSSILNYVENSQIAIPEIQRPFVWKGEEVRALIDSLYEGYPIGYLIVWQNSQVRVRGFGKGGTKKILIDGQQRVTALMAALLGKEVLDEQYQSCRIRIAFNPLAQTGDERFAVCDEKLLEKYLETGSVDDTEIRELIVQRKLFPCYFGSALHLQGVEELMNGICTYQMQKEYPAVFGAKVYKIARDGQGNRLTYLKVTGGTLKVKDVIGENGDKVNQIRVYSGEKYELLSEADAGKVCAVTGLAETYPGQGLGAEKDSELPILEPVLTYRIILPDDCNVHTMLRDLKLLEEEEPELHVVWIEKSQEIHVQLMGDVQIEILQRIIKERFGVLVEFGEGSIVYKETIAAPVEGVGHFEPLRHYAEVHLRLEPGERGSGIQFDSECSEDVLDRNWQRLVLTHLEEKEHKGVLTGSVITDMKITLTSGKAHLKHTEGGDFRQATYRAVRQGLKKAESVLLEPYYAFRLEIPSEMTGRALTDIQRMNGEFDGPETEDDMAVVTGSAPVSEMQDYQREVTTYSRGRGKLFCTLKGYFPCHNQDEVVEAIGYDQKKVWMRLYR